MEALFDKLNARSIDYNRVMGRPMSAIGKLQFSCPRHGEYMATGTRLASRDIWTRHRKSHNQGVFDIYSPDVLAARIASRLASAA